MKTIFYITTLLLGSYTFAQTKPVDEMKSTQIITETVKENGKMVNKKVKVVTEKKKEVKTDPSRLGEIDAPMVDSPTKVTKTISVDKNNNDNFEKISEISYYTFGDSSYGFKSTISGFEVIQKSPSDNKNSFYGTARRTQNKDVYLITMRDFSGVGYFNKENDFVIEYYDENKDLMQLRAFKQTKF